MLKLNTNYGFHELFLNFNNLTHVWHTTVSQNKILRLHRKANKY